MPEQLYDILGRGGPRLLAEVTAVLSHRRVAVLSVSAWPTDIGEYRIHLVADVADPVAAELLHKRLDRIVGVVKTVRLETADSHSRQAVLIRVQADAATRGQIVDLARAFGADVVEVGAMTVSLFFGGDPVRVDELLALLAPFGVREHVCTSTVSLRRGERPRRAANKSAPLRSVVA
jgi:acetolactate synthase-1/3 small subunit